MISSCLYLLLDFETLLKGEHYKH